MLNKNKHDISQIFLIYMALVGDIQKVSLATDVPEADIEEMAKREGWADKVRRISVMSKSGKPGDWERAQNRALNFVQVHQLRRTIDRVIAHLSEQEAKEIIEHTTHKGDLTLSARLLTDLASAMQRIHEMSYSALGDSVKERDPEGTGAGAELNSAALHASLIGALNSAKLPGTTPEAIVAETVETVQGLKSANPAA